MRCLRLPRNTGGSGDCLDFTGASIHPSKYMIRSIGDVQVAAVTPDAGWKVESSIHAQSVRDHCRPAGDRFHFTGSRIDRPNASFVFNIEDVADAPYGT